MQVRTLLTGLLLLLNLHAVSAKIRIEVTVTPPLLLPDKPLYMASSLNNWSPGNPEYALKKDANGIWFIEINQEPAHFEYKFTQGNWTMAEGNAEGLPIPNRTYNAASESDPTLIRVTIAGWEAKVPYTFIVTSLPQNTPADATLYIMGNFNNWDPGNPLYQLYRNVDGTYRTTVYTDLERLEYKFTRGSMEAVEGRASGKARQNRSLKRQAAVQNLSIETRIESWEDLSATFNFYSLYDLLLLFSAFQGILLLIAIPTIQNYNRRANYWLGVTIAVASAAILLRIAGSYREVAMSFTKILLLPDFILFTYAPLFYLYLQRLLYNQSPPLKQQFYLFIPFMIQCFVYLPFFLMNERSLQLSFINQDPWLMGVFLLTGFTALLWNAYFWYRFRGIYGYYRNEFQSHFSYEQNLQYLNTVHNIQGICLALWAFLFVVLAAGRIFILDTYQIVESSVHIIWLAFSTITYFVGFYAIHQPEIFKVNTQNNPVFGKPTVPAALPEVAKTTPTEEPDNLSVLKQALEAYMTRHKPYTNPRLSLNELAGKMKLSPHTLSRVINEGFEMNFFDLVNTWRIDEFKRRVENPKNSHFTLLGIAYDVGFNSKTAFNRSFKKITGMTPSEYYQEARMGD